MSNKYAGICYRCGKEVPPGTGVFEKVSRSQIKKWPNLWLPKWLVQHHSCAVEFRGTKQHYQYKEEDVL